MWPKQLYAFQQKADKPFNNNSRAIWDVPRSSASVIKYDMENSTAASQFTNFLKAIREEEW